jgi:hypothetical protein
MIKETVGSRGKTAEKLVLDALKALNTRESMTFFRLADARAAAGPLAKQPGDFVYFSKGVGGIIEVKSTQHAYRLTKNSVSQLPMLKKLTLAGARSIILILHKGEKVWRVVQEEHLAIEQPSWDLRSYKTFSSAEDALLSTGIF